MQALDPGKYQLGRLCKRGHDHEDSGQSLRYKGSCVACQRLTAANYRAALDPEVRRKREHHWYNAARAEGRQSFNNRVIQAQKWKQDHPERRKEIQRRYVKNRRQRIAEARRISQQKNLDINRIKTRARGLTFGAIKRGEVPHPNTVPCTDCGCLWAPGDNRHEYDHYMGYEGENGRIVQAVCKECHTAREVRRRRALRLDQAA